MPELTLPPGPRFTLPATLSLIRNPYRTLRDLHLRHGDLVTFPSPNGRIVLAMTPALAKPILTAPPDMYGPWATQTLPTLIGGRSLLVTEGETHKRDRKLLTPAFHGARMRAYGDAMRAAARRRFEQHFTPGATVRIQDVMVDITVDVILETVFGVSQGPDFDRGRSILSDLVSSLSPFLFFSRAAHTPVFPPYRRFLRVRANFRDFLNEQIAGARGRGERGQDVLAMMLAARYDDGTAMNDEDVAGQLVTLLFAGHETTAIALSWAVHWLGRTPQALARVRAEIESVGGVNGGPREHRQAAVSVCLLRRDLAASSHRHREPSTLESAAPARRVPAARRNGGRRGIR